jgi:hypothetical protein
MSQTHHSDRSLLRVVAHYQVNLPDVETFLSNRCGYQNIKDTALELIDDLWSEECE